MWENAKREIRLGFCSVLLINEKKKKMFIIKLHDNFNN